MLGGWNRIDYLLSFSPARTRYRNVIVSAPLRRDNVASTLTRCHSSCFSVMIRLIAWRWRYSGHTVTTWYDVISVVFLLLLLFFFICIVYWNVFGNQPRSIFRGWNRTDSLCPTASQTHGVGMPSHQRRCDVKTSQRRWLDVISVVFCYVSNIGLGSETAHVNARWVNWTDCFMTYSPAGPGIGMCRVSVAATR